MKNSLRERQLDRECRALTLSGASGGHRAAVRFDELLDDPQSETETAMRAFGIALPDPVAMAIALDPTICTSASNHHVEIECDSELTRGQTVVDRLNVADDERNRGVWSTFRDRPKNVSVCWSIDIAQWKRLLTRSLV